MNRARWLVAAVAVGSCAVSTGCWGRKAKAAPTLVMLPPPPPPAKQEPIPEPPRVDSGTAVASLPPSPIEEPVQAPKPFEPPKPARPAPRPAAQSPAPAPPEAPPAEIPQLVPLLSPAEQERYNREIADHLKRAEDTLSWIGDRRLNQLQRDNVLRARTFVRQAQDLRQSDLLTARSLAQRADVLAQDVASSFR